MKSLPLKRIIHEIRTIILDGIKNTSLSFQLWKAEKPKIAFSGGHTGTVSLGHAFHGTQYGPFVRPYVTHGISIHSKIHLVKCKGMHIVHALSFHYPSLKKIKTPIFIATGVRDPIATMLSFYVAIDLRWGMKLDINRNSATYKIKMEKHFIRYRKILKKKSHLFLDWFDKVFIPDTGVNIYDVPFDKENGYSIVRMGKINVFVLKTEAVRKPNHCAFLEQKFSEFVGEKTYALDYASPTDAALRPYKELYREIVDNFTVDDAFLDYIYNSKYVKHFYTDEEINGFRMKWGAKIQ